VLWHGLIERRQALAGTTCTLASDFRSTTTIWPVAERMDSRSTIFGRDYWSPTTFAGEEKGDASGELFLHSQPSHHSAAVTAATRGLKM
jgi:hypothetical protein